jgi:uncharacterized membrane protein YgcG
MFAQSIFFHVLGKNETCLPQHVLDTLGTIGPGPSSSTTILAMMKPTTIALFAVCALLALAAPASPLMPSAPQIAGTAQVHSFRFGASTSRSHSHGHGNRVYDPDRLLLPDEREDLERASAALMRSGACWLDTGVDIAVVVLAHNPKHRARGLDENLQSSEESELHKVQRGTTTSKNSVLLLVSVTERRAHIAAGQVARKTLTESITGDIVRDMLPYLHQGRPQRAILVGLQGIGEVVHRGGCRWAHRGLLTSWGAHLVYAAALIMGVCLLLACRNGVQRSRVERGSEQESAGLNDPPVTAEDQ